MANPALKNIHKLIQSKKEVIPIGETFVNDLGACIEKLNAQEARKPSKAYKPSSMNCIRNMYFQRIGAEPEEERSSSPSIGVRESGSDRHERIQNAIKAMKDYGMDCEYIDVEEFIKRRKLTDLKVTGKRGIETKVYHTKLNMSFMCDGIIKYKGKYYILEIKTESMHKWISREGVAKEHESQGAAYSVAFEIDLVLYLYENRDNCLKKGYLLNVTEEMKDELVVAKISACDNYVKNLVVPPKAKDIEKKICTYCKYKALCKKAK